MGKAREKDSEDDMYRLEINGRIPTLNQWIHYHYFKKGAVKKEWGEVVVLTALEAKVPKPINRPVNVVVTQFCKAMVRDVDNAVVSWKIAGDALVKHGFLEDDSPKFVQSLLLKTKKGKEDKTVIIIQ
jgi:Holliday junction resolvase RusA-like endonuclease